MACSGCPSRVLHLADSGWLTYSCGGRFCGVGGVLVLHLVFYLVSARLPLSGFCPLLHLLLTLRRCSTLSGPSLRVYFCGWVGGVFAASLGFLPCAVLFLRACSLRSFPSCRLSWGFRSPGVCPSASLVTLVGLQPFPSFSVLLLLRLLAGVGWVMHLVSGCSSCGGVCLG